MCTLTGVTLTRPKSQLLLELSHAGNAWYKVSFNGPVGGPNNGRNTMDVATQLLTIAHDLAQDVKESESTELLTYAAGRASRRLARVYHGVDTLSDLQALADRMRVIDTHELAEVLDEVNLVRSA